MKFHFIIIIFLFSNIANAQQSIRVLYESRFKAPKSATKTELLSVLYQPRLYQLTNNGNLSEFRSIEKKRKEETTQGKENRSDTIFLTTVGLDESICLKDFAENINYCKYRLSDRFVYVQDPFQNQQITYKADVKKIDIYKCKLAESFDTINSGLIKYWYTTDIPIVDGPLLYWVNLPGLILHIDAPLVDYYAVKIEFINDILPINKFPTSTRFISSIEFEQELNVDKLDDKKIKIMDGPPSK